MNTTQGVKVRRGKTITEKKETKRKDESTEVPYWNFLGLGLVLRSSTSA